MHILNDSFNFSLYKFIIVIFIYKFRIKIYCKKGIELSIK